MIINELDQPAQPKIYVDMDGVLADFDKKYRELFHRDPLPAGSDENVGRLVGTNFFSQLDKMPNADQVVALAKKLGRGNWYICSSPLRGDHANSKENKIKWLAKMGYDPNDVIITPRKESYAVNRIDGTANVLIDDKPKNINRWQDAGGIGVLYSGYTDKIADIAQQLRRQNFGKKL